MNNYRRKAIDAVIVKLEECQSDISMIGEEEQEYADNMPENLQMSERCGNAQEVASNLDTLSMEIESLIDQLREAAG